MKRQGGAPAPAKAGNKMRVWLAYASAGVLLATGQAFLLKDRLALGGGLMVAGALLAAAAWVLPGLPWADWLRTVRAASARRPGVADRGSKASALAAGASKVPVVPRRTIADFIESLASRLPETNRLEFSRAWLFLPAAILLLMSQLALGQGSIVRAVGLFAAAGALLAIYMQEGQRPLVLPQLRRNLRSALLLGVGVPLHAVGAYLLHAYFTNRSMVWLGFFLCMAGSFWMIWFLKKAPFDLQEPNSPEPALDWSPPSIFFSTARLTFVSSMLAAAGLSAYLAKFVFPAEHPGWSVGLGFLAIALLVGSFPWLPRGLAWAGKISDQSAALLSLAAALVAFGLGKLGQDYIQRGNISLGLWAFLAGGVILILTLSRFQSPLTPKIRAEGRESLPRFEIAAVALLVAVAFAFRIWKIGTFPYGVEGDEGGGGVWAMDTLMGRVEHPLIHQNYPLAFFSVTAFFFKFAGVSLETLRWHSVFFGTLSIVTTYLFLRLLTGRWPAFLATLLMSFSYWHLHYSRFGHYNIEQIALQMVAFYFVFKAFASGRLWHWVVGGLAFGLAMLPHMASRLLPFQGLALVLYFFVARRDLLRRHLPGFLAFVLAAWAVAAPAVVYWNRARSISMGRIQSVSIFDKNNSNAPADTLGGFVRNTKVSILMFNQISDTRSRNNPLAPEKILEYWTAILFALAFIFVLYHWRDPLSFFLLSIFFINLAASVFSVEAPQTLRTAANIPIVFAFIALLLAALRSSLLRLGHFTGTAIFALLLLPAFAFFSWRSYQKLFVDARKLAFDTHPTYIAQVAGKEGGPDTQGVFWGSGFASGHPPMILLAQQTPLRNFYGPFEYLPIVKAVDRDHLLFLSDQYQLMLPYVQWLYPTAPVEPIPDLVGGGDLAKYIRVNKDLLKSMQGLSGRMVAGGTSVEVKGVDPHWPSPGVEKATRLSLTGSVVLDTWARYSFTVSGRGAARLLVNGQEAFTRGGGAREMLLAKGLHRMDLELAPLSSTDRMAVKVSAAQPATVLGPWMQRGRKDFDLESAQIITVPVHGFYAEYFNTLMPEGRAVTELIEPVVLNHWLDSPLVGNWSARWRARFKVEQAGEYAFSIQTGAQFTQVKVNGRLVWRRGMHPAGEMKPPEVLPAIVLQPGWHDYEAIFSTTGSPACHLRWTRPGEKEELFFTPDLVPVGPRPGAVGRR